MTKLYSILSGGIGCHLFQAVAGYVLAKRHKLPFALSYEKGVGDLQYQYKYSKLFAHFSQQIEEYQPDNIITPHTIYNEPPTDGAFSFHGEEIDKLIESTEKDRHDIYLKGSFKHENYFKHEADEIRKMLLSCFRERSHELHNIMTKMYYDCAHTYFIHISETRKDIDLKKYYKMSLNLISNLDAEATFVVFSDNLDTCCSLDLFPKEQLDKIVYFDKLFGGEIGEIGEINEIDQLLIMSLLNGGICSYSSFSWWGAYLGEQSSHTKRLVVFPDDIGYISTDHTHVFQIPINGQFPGTRRLTETTFIFPVRIEHEDRLWNLKINLNYLLSNFNTSIILIEEGVTSVFYQQASTLFKDVRLLSHITYQFNVKRETMFHRMAYLNQGTTIATTPVIVVADIDCILPLNSYIYSEKAITTGTFDIVHPFSNPPGQFMIFQQHRDKLYRQILQNKCDLLDTKFLAKCGRERAGNGFLIFFKLSEYIRMGMEDVRFRAYGPEDDERIYRALSHGLRYGRKIGPVFHIEHYRSPNSSKKNPFFKDNCKLFEKLKKEYIKQNIDPLKQVKLFYFI